MASRMTDALSSWEETLSASGSCCESAEKISDSLLLRHLAASRDFSLRFSEFLRRSFGAVGTPVAPIAAVVVHLGLGSSPRKWQAVSGHCRGLHADSGTVTMRQILTRRNPLREITGERAPNRAVEESDQNARSTQMDFRCEGRDGGVTAACSRHKKHNTTRTPLALALKT